MFTEAGPVGTSRCTGRSTSVPASLHSFDVSHGLGVLVFQVEVGLLAVTRSTGSVVGRTGFRSTTRDFIGVLHFVLVGELSRVSSS